MTSGKADVVFAWQETSAVGVQMPIEAGMLSAARRVVAFHDAMSSVRYRELRCMRNARRFQGRLFTPLAAFPGAEFGVAALAAAVRHLVIGGSGAARAAGRGS